MHCYGCEKEKTTLLSVIKGKLMLAFGLSQYRKGGGVGRGGGAIQVFVLQVGGSSWDAVTRLASLEYKVLS